MQRSPDPRDAAARYRTVTDRSQRGAINGWRVMSPKIYTMPVDRKQQDLPSGWVKPERKLTLAELQTLIEKKKAEVRLLESEAFDLWHEERLRAIAKARNITRADACRSAGATGTRWQTFLPDVRILARWTEQCTLNSHSLRDPLHLSGARCVRPP